jgi:hypothetical protein
VRTTRITASRGRTKRKPRGKPRGFFSFEHAGAGTATAIRPHPQNFS